MELVKLGLHHDATILRDRVITLVWREGGVLQWCDAVLKMLHKKKGQTDCENYRGIALVDKDFPKVVAKTRRLLGGRGTVA